MQQNIKSLTLAALLSQACSAAQAGQFSISCLFKTSSEGIRDPVALEWAMSPTITLMEWVMGTDPLRIINGPGALDKKTGSSTILIHWFQISSGALLP